MKTSRPGLRPREGPGLCVGAEEQAELGQGQGQAELWC